MTTAERQRVIEQAIRDLGMIREDLRRAACNDAEPFLGMAVVGLAVESDRIGERLLAAAA